jgi:hypothetical protein
MPSVGSGSEVGVGVAGIVVLVLRGVLVTAEASGEATGRGTGVSPQAARMKVIVRRIPLTRDILKFAVR